jgi:hypothetical protein
MPEKRFFPGTDAQPNRWLLICPINDIYSGTLRRFAIGLHFVCEKCARPEGRVGAGRAATFPTAFVANTFGAFEK